MTDTSSFNTNVAYVNAVFAMNIASINFLELYLESVESTMIVPSDRERSTVAGEIES